jgi:hypothetical protein
MKKRQRIRNPKDHFSIIPNMYDDADLTVYEFRLLIHYRRVGNCYESLRTTAKKCNIGKSTVERARKSLAEKGWITLEVSDQGTTLITVIDKWTKPLDVGGTNQGVPQGDSLQDDVPEGDGVSQAGTECPTEGIKEVPIKKNLSRSKEPIKEKKKRKRDPLFDAIAEVCQVDPATCGASIGKVKAALTKADPPYTAEDVKQFGEWWWFDRFRLNRGIPPTVWQLQERIGVIRSHPNSKKRDPVQVDGEIARRRQDARHRLDQAKGKANDSN